MTIIDISVPLQKGMHIYPGDMPFYVTPHKMLHADGMNLSRLELGSHNGTHIDVPAHFIPGGATTEATGLEALVGPAYVADLTVVPEAEPITVERLQALSLPEGTERLLLKTRNSKLWHASYFQPRFVHLAVEAARWLAERRLRTVGIDYLSIEKFGATRPDAHLALLGVGTIILEGLDLSHVEPGRSYDLVCLPLKIPGIDGAPARAVLMG